MAVIHNTDSNNNFIGTEQNDTFDSVSVGASTYFGLGGDDEALPILAGDTFDGGSGFDSMEAGYVGDSAFPLIVRLDRGYVTGDYLESGRAFLVSVERLFVSGGSQNTLPSVMIGDDFDNVLENFIGGSFARGNAGNDSIIFFGGGDFTVLGDDGDDYLFVGRSANWFGTPLPSYASGGSGNDTVVGDGLVDGNILLGGDGNDQVTSGEGSDRLYGGAGDDVLMGGIGDDRLFGDDGVDLVNGGEGNDILFAGTGFGDVLNGDGGDDRLFGNAQTATLNGGDGRDLLLGGAGVETLSGGSGIDRLFGNGGIDTLDGGAGNDLLNGGDGADLFMASGGVDRATLGAGADQVFMAGQINGDQFKIYDFDITEDVIRLDQAGIPDFQTVLDHAVDRSYGGVIVDLSVFNLGLIVLENITKAILSADDFGF